MTHPKIKITFDYFFCNDICILEYWKFFGVTKELVDLRFETSWLKSMVGHSGDSC